MKNRLPLSLLLMLCMFIQTALAQQFNVTGKVTDAASGAALVGVTINIKGTNTGASTAANGSYSLQVSAKDILVFSTVGYSAQEKTVGAQKVINIGLTATSEALEEVMVVAYGTAKKSTFTGSASTVKVKEIEDQPNSSFEKALAGRVSGLQVSTTSGQAGATSAIRIRGIGSMNASSEPLYVIDGVPVISGNAGGLNEYIQTTSNVMSTLNPSDIESLTVLKDAAASALYGSRAANGVIIITTKKGKNGAPKINVKSSLGFTPTWATDNWEAASTQDQVNTLYKVFHDYNTANGRTEEFANTNALSRLNTKFKKHGYYFETAGLGLNENVNILGMTDGIENREGKYYDWNDALFRTGTFQSNDISVSGGTDNTKYYSSLGYTKDKSRIILNDYERINGRVNLTQNIGKYLEFGSNINIANTNNQGMNDTRNTGTNYLLQTRNLLWGLYWPTNYKTGNDWTERYGSLAYNPFYYNTQWENSSKTRKISAVESLSLKLTSDLTLKTVFSYDNTQVRDHLYYSANHYNGASTNGVVHEISTSITKLVSSTTANYNKKFGDHNLNLLAGFEAEKNETDFLRATGKDLPNSALHTVATAGDLNASAYAWGNNLMSGLARAEYNFQEKYFASASIRTDGSSKLGATRQWGDFWSIAGSWKINNESFLKGIEQISNLRIKASYGVNGTLPSPNYGAMNLVGYSNKYMGKPGATLDNIADPNLSWETNYTTNLGLEFGLFNQRLYGSVEYFNRDSKNLIQDVPTSSIIGFSSTLKNIGEINNKGIEVELGADIYKKENLRWSASVNAAFLTSKVTKLYRNAGADKGQDIIWNDPTGSDARTRFIYREGESTLAYYGLEWAGVDAENGKNVWFTNDNTNGDFLKDGRGATYNYNKASRTIIGNANPNVYGGINTDVEYKGLSLGLNFIYKLGGKLYDAANKDVADDGYYWERLHSQDYVDNNWSTSNPNSDYPKISGNDLEDVNQVSSRHLYNASFIRLKNVTLAYRIPASFIQKAGISNARIYFNGSNLFTASKYKLADPEVNQYGTRGWETPIGKTYTFGVEFSF